MGGLPEEGFEYHFVHKSVAEFHAAAFISRAPEEVARKFYSVVQSGHAWMRWQQELIFLAEIDRLRYLKLYLIPALLHDLNELGFNAVRCSPARSWEDVRAVLNKIKIHWSHSGKPDGTAEFSFSIGSPCSEFGQQAFLEIVSQHHDFLSENPQNQTLSLLGDVLSFKRMQPVVTGLLREVSTELHTKLTSAQSEIQQEVYMLDLIDPDELNPSISRRRQRSMHRIRRS